MSTKLKYQRIEVTADLSSSVLLQIRTGTATGSQLVATVQVTLDSTLRAVREKLVDIAVRGTATSAASAGQADLVGLSAEDIQSIVSHKLHAFDMSAQFEFVHSGGCHVLSSEQERNTCVHQAIPVVPSYGLPTTSPAWHIIPKPGCVAVSRPFFSKTKLTINITRSAIDTTVAKACNALLVLYVRQGDGTPQELQGDAHGEKVMVERLLMSDVPFGKVVTPKHLSMLLSKWNINTKDLLGRTILHECCADGNLPAVRYLLSLSSDMFLSPDTVDNYGRTCLHYAVLGGHQDVVSELLAKNSDPSIRSTARKFYFSDEADSVIKGAELELAAASRALPFNPLHPDFAGRTPLHIALSKRNDALTEVLCMSVAAMPFEAIRVMHLCLYNLYFGLGMPVGFGLVGSHLEEATQKAVKVGGKARLPWKGEERFASVTSLFASLSPSLMQLAADGNVDAMIALLSHPLFDRKHSMQRGPTGESLLHLAARNGKTDMVRFLFSDDFIELFPENDFLPNEGDPKAGAMLDGCGRTPLHFACMNGYSDTLLELLRRASATTIQPETITSPGDDRALIVSTNNGEPLRKASIRNRFALTNLDVNAIDVCGCLALHWALRKKHMDAARVMLEVYREAVGTSSGLLVSLSDRHGMTPLHIAAALGADDVVHTLVGDYRVHPNTRVLTTSSYKSSAAISAELVRQRKERSNTSGTQLVEAGAGPLVSTKHVTIIVKSLSPSPLWLALQEGRQVTATLLIELGALANEAQEANLGMLPAIVDLDLSPSGDASPRRGTLFMSPTRASRGVPSLPATRPIPHQTDANIMEASYWHAWAMLKLSLDNSLLGIAQSILASMHDNGFADRLALDTQLLIAFAAKGNDFGLRWLLDRGVGKASHGQRDGLTILSACCYARNIEAVKYLLEAVEGIDATCGSDGALSPDRFTVTPLYMAIASSRHEAASSELVELLIKYGAAAARGLASAVTPPAPANASLTPKSSLYQPLVQATLRGDFSIAQTLCASRVTSPRDAAVALWWLLNAVPSTSDAHIVRRSMARVLEHAEGRYSKQVRTIFGEAPSLSHNASTYSPTLTGVAQYDAIALTLIRKMGPLVESPIHPLELLHAAAAKLWHFSEFVRHLVAAIAEMPMDIRRAIIDTAVKLDATYAQRAEREKELALSRIGQCAPSAFVDSMHDGSYVPYHRVVDRDAFTLICRNGPSTAQGMSEWYSTLRIMAEDCGLFPSGLKDYTKRNCADYAVQAAHRPTVLYLMTLGLLPVKSAASASPLLAPVVAIASEVISRLRTGHSIDYASSTVIVKVAIASKKPPVPSANGKVKGVNRPLREAPEMVPAVELQEAAILANLLTLVGMGDAPKVRSALADLGTLCRIADFSPLPRANRGSSGPTHPTPASIAVRITTQWGSRLVLRALEAGYPAIATLLVDEHHFDISSPVIPLRVGGAGDAYQLLPNAIAIGCKLETIQMLMRNKVPINIPSPLTKGAQKALKKRLPTIATGGTYTALFVAAACHRMDIVRGLHSFVCLQDKSADRFAQIFTLEETRQSLAEPVCYDALAAVLASTAVSSSVMATSTAAEIAQFLVTKGQWPYVNPYLLRITALKGHWALARLLLQSYGPAIVVADLKVRAAEVAEEERLNGEKKGLAASTSVVAPVDDTLNDIEAMDFASPVKIKGLNKCSAISAMMRLLGATAASNGEQKMVPQPEGAATLKLAIDLLATHDRGFRAEGVNDEDREVDTIDEQLERLKTELKHAVQPTSSLRTYGGPAIPTMLSQQSHNVRLPTSLTTIGTSWDAILLGHRPSLLKGIMISGASTSVAGYLALLAFCTQPLALVAPPVQCLAIKGKASSASLTAQQLMSLLFSLTRNAETAAMVPSDGFHRLLFILKAAVRRNQPQLLQLLLESSPAVIANAGLTDLAAVKGSLVDSLLYLSLQHMDGQCTNAIREVMADNPKDAILRTLCCGSELWSSDSVAIPFAAAVCQLGNLAFLGRVERAPREQLASKAIRDITLAKGNPMASCLLDVSSIHSTNTYTTSAPSLMALLRPVLGHLPGGALLVAASPLLISVMLGQEGLVSQLLAQRAVSARCSSSRAFTTIVDYKASLAYHKTLMTGPDEGRRLHFLRDGSLSSTIAIPVVNVAAALCLRSANALQSATSQTSQRDASPAAFSEFKKRALVLRSLIQHGALHADNIAAISVAMGHILRILSGMKVPSATKVAINTAKAELLQTFVDSANSRGAPFLTAVRFADKVRHVCLYNTCDMANNRHMLHSLLRAGPGAAPIDADTLRTVLKYSEPTDVEMATDGSGRTALYYLLASDCPQQVLDTLLKVRPQARSARCHSKGWTPLMVVCRKGRVDGVLTSLLTIPALREVDVDGRSALWHASSVGHEGLVKVIIDFIRANGEALADYLSVEDSQGLNPFLASAAAGRDSMAMKLLEYLPAKLVFALARSQRWYDGHAGATIFHCAAKGNCQRLMQYLLDLQASAPNDFAKLASSVLRSQQSQQGSVAYSLGPHRALTPYMQQDQFGDSALSLAYHLGHAEVLGKLLLALRSHLLRGGAPSYANANGASAMAAALVQQLGDVPDEELSACDRCLLTGVPFNPFTGSNIAHNDDPAKDLDDPIYKAKLRQDARMEAEDADRAARLKRRAHKVKFAHTLPIGWLKAAMALDAALGADQSLSPAVCHPINDSSESLLRWCVKNRFVAGIRVCSDLGLLDATKNGHTSALHIAAKCLNVEAVQLLLSLNLSSPFALDRYGRTALDLCLVAGAKGVAEDGSGSEQPIPSAAEQCARFLITTMFAKPATMTQFKQPDGSLYINTLFYKIAGTQMPDLVGVVEGKLLEIAGGGSAVASALFTLQVLQKQDCESKRYATIMSKLGLLAEAELNPDRDGSDSNGSSPERNIAHLYTDVYTAFEVSLLHGCAAMTLRISETIRRLAIIAAKGTMQPAAKGQQDMHPLGTISLGAAFLRDHLLSVSPTVRAVLFDLFRVTAVAKSCGMQRIEAKNVAEPQPKDSMSNNSDTEDESEAKPKPTQTPPPPKAIRLTFADVRALGIGMLRQQPSLGHHVEAIYTLAHERTVALDELLPYVAQLPSEGSSIAPTNAIKFEVDDSINSLPEHMQKLAYRALPTSAVAGRYRELRATEHLPFLSTIVIKFVEDPDEACGLGVSPEGPPRLVDTIAISEGCVRSASSLEEVTTEAEHVVGAHLPLLRKQLDAGCSQLADFFRSKAPTAPIWKAFPFGQISVRVDWTCSYPSISFDAQATVQKLFGTFNQRYGVMGQNKELALEVETAMQTLLGPDGFGSRLATEHPFATKGQSSVSILELLTATLIDSGFNKESPSPDGSTQPPRGICFTFVPSPKPLDPSSGPTLTADLLLPLTAADVVAKYREGSEVIIPFCSLGLGRPYRRGDGTLALEPILIDPLATYLSPLTHAISAAGAKHSAQSLKDMYLLQPMRDTLAKTTGGKLPDGVAEFCRSLRFKLELEDPSSYDLIPNVQVALQNLASILADVARSLPAPSSADALNTSLPNYSPINAFSTLESDPHTIVPMAMARNLFGTVRSVTVIMAPSGMKGYTRRVPNGSSGTGKNESIGDGAKIVLVVSPTEGFQYSAIRQQLWVDTLRIEMARVPQVLQATMSDFRHQLATYFPTIDFAMNFIAPLLTGPTPISPAMAEANPSLLHEYITTAEKALYRSELIKLASAPTPVPSMILQPLIKGLAVGWDTTLGTRLREVIKVVSIAIPMAPPLPDISFSPATGRPRCITFDATSGSVSYECPALYYPPPCSARHVSELLLGAEAIAGQLLTAVNDTIDLSSSVEMGKAFAPFCTVRYVSCFAKHPFDHSHQADSLWRATAGQQVHFVLQTKNILNLTLGEGLVQYNKAQAVALQRELTEALTSEIAGQTGRIEVGRRLKQIQRRVAALGHSVKVSATPLEAVRVFTKRTSSQAYPEHQIEIGADGLGTGEDNSSFLPTNFTVKPLGASAIAIAFDAPKAAGLVSVRLTLYGTTIDCGSGLQLEVLPSPTISLVDKQALFPTASSFFRNTRLSKKVNVNAIQRGVPFTAHIGLKDINGNPCDPTIAPMIRLILGEELQSEYQADRGTTTNMPTARLGVSLQGATADQLTISKAALIADRNAVLVLALTLISGPEKKSDRKRSEADDEPRFQLDNVKAVIQLGGSQTVETTTTCSLFPSLYVLSPSDWEAAEGARRGILGDLTFMRESKGRVRKAIRQHYVSVLEAGDDKVKLRHIIKESPQQQYEKMKKRLAERCALYFRANIRRAQLARRQTEVAAANAKGFIVPNEMLQVNMNDTLRVDEEALKKLAAKDFEAMKKNQSRRLKKGNADAEY